MIRVGEDYYLTGTTMHAMPGLPVLHSKDLVNWKLLGCAFDRLDFGPGYRLEGGKAVYGQGIWAPSFRYHNGTFHIFTNINGHNTQLFRARNPAGPWTRTELNRSFHDLSVLFDDGKVYVIWGYQDIKFAQLNEELTDIVPGTERTIINKEAGMGEGCHFYLSMDRNTLRRSDPAFSRHTPPHSGRTGQRHGFRRPSGSTAGPKRRIVLSLERKRRPLAMSSHELISLTSSRFL